MKELFAFSPNTFGIPAVYWMNGSIISSALPEPWKSGDRTNMPNSAVIQAHANLVTPGINPVYFDSEAVPDLPTMMSCIQQFQIKAPGLRRGCYGPTPIYNREEYAKAVLDPTHPLNAWLKTFIPLFKTLDYIDLPSYLLGPQWVDRDLAYMKASRTLFRKYFPQCKIMYSIWGNYHTNWNPPNTAIPQDVIKKLAFQIYENEDAAVIFDLSMPRDEFFWEYLVQKKNA